MKDCAQNVQLLYFHVVVKTHWSLCKTIWSCCFVCINGHVQVTVISKSFTLFDVRPAGRPWFSPCNFVKQQVFPIIIFALFPSNIAWNFGLVKQRTCSSSIGHLRASGADQMCVVRVIYLFKGFYTAGKGALFPQPINMHQAQLTRPEVLSVFKRTGIPGLAVRFGCF